MATAMHAAAPVGLGATAALRRQQGPRQPHRAVRCNASSRVVVAPRRSARHVSSRGPSPLHAVSPPGTEEEIDDAFVPKELARARTFLPSLSRLFSSLA
jgi:hypothetical protein